MQLAVGKVLVKLEVKKRKMVVFPQISQFASPFAQPQPANFHCGLPTSGCRLRTQDRNCAKVLKITQIIFAKDNIALTSPFQKLHFQQNFSLPPPPPKKG